LEELLNGYWWLDRYIKRDGDRVRLADGVTQKQIWQDFQREYPQHVNDGTGPRVDTKVLQAD
jgi:hypothetical protein